MVENLRLKPRLAVLEVSAGTIAKGVKQGDSIAVDGVCLTVTGKRAKTLTFDMMLETLRTTTLGRLIKGDRVNLERALKASDRLDGHFVSGHIDAVGRIKDRVRKTNYLELTIGIPHRLIKYIVPKGSVCVDGVSLTVGKVGKDYFSVYLIPYTKQVTMLGAKSKGDRVNIETDILAKYLLKKK